MERVKGIEPSSSAWKEVSYFAQIIICDFEFEAPDGGRPNPICMVARELLGAKREWRGGGGGVGAPPPLEISQKTKIVCYYSAAAKRSFFSFFSCTRPPPGVRRAE